MLSCYILIASEGMPIQQIEIKEGEGKMCFFCVWKKSWVDLFSAPEADSQL